MIFIFVFVYEKKKTKIKIHKERMFNRQIIKRKYLYEGTH